MCWSMHHSMRRGCRMGVIVEKVIQFVSYNICNGRNGGLEYALQGMAQAKLDLKFSKRPRSPMASTRGSQQVNVSLRLTQRSGTVVASAYYIARPKISKLSLIRQMGQT